MVSRVGWAASLVTCALLVMGCGDDASPASSRDAQDTEFLDTHSGERGPDVPRENETDGPFWPADRMQALDGPPLGSVWDTSAPLDAPPGLTASEAEAGTSSPEAGVVTDAIFEAGTEGRFRPAATLCARCAPGEVLQQARATMPYPPHMTGAGCLPAVNPDVGCGPYARPCALANALAKCVEGACAISVCQPGWGDCDGKAQNGCEADLTATTSCVACGVECGAGQFCSPSGCVAECAPPLTKLGARCRDLANDPVSCGCTPQGNFALYACRDRACDLQCLPGTVRALNGTPFRVIARLHTPM